MRKVLSKKAAGIILIYSLSFLMTFHLLVAVKVLPGDIVWGGTLDEDSVVKYEAAAFLITGLLLFFAAAKSGYITNRIVRKTADIFIWIMVVYFAFMMFANLSAKTLTEKVLFIPLSALMFVSSLRIAFKK